MSKVPVGPFAPTTIRFQQNATGWALCGMDSNLVVYYESNVSSSIPADEFIGICIPDTTSGTSVLVGGTVSLRSTSPSPYIHIGTNGSVVQWCDVPLPEGFQVIGSVQVTGRNLYSLTLNPRSSVMSQGLAIQAAYSLASTANGNANAAIASAASAQSTADTAQIDATQALADSAAAQGDATLALADAAAAQADATLAQSTANNAQTTANNASTSSLANQLAIRERTQQLVTYSSAMVTPGVGSTSYFTDNSGFIPVLGLPIQINNATKKPILASSLVDGPIIGLVRDIVEEAGTVTVYFSQSLFKDDYSAFGGGLAPGANYVQKIQISDGTLFVAYNMAQALQASAPTAAVGETVYQYQVLKDAVNCYDAAGGASGYVPVVTA